MKNKYGKIVIGNRYGYWRALRKDSNKSYHTICLCTGCNSIERSLRNLPLVKGDSKSCGCKQTELMLETSASRHSPSELQQRKKDTMMEKYGVENASQLPMFQEKKRETWIAKYGVDNPQKALEVQEKTRATNLERYGAENPMLNTSIQDKLKQTNLDKYGVEYSCIAPTVQEKKKRTCLEKYGVDNYRKSDRCKEQVKATHKEKYGQHYSSTKEYRQKYILTSLERYGVSHKSQLPSQKNRLRDWCDKNPTLKGSSQAERELLSWIQSFYSSAQKYRTSGNELDIFIPEINLGIEYNGLYWHNEARRNCDYHLNKTLFFASRGIRTIHIFEHEWKNSREQVKSFIQSAIHKNSNKIGARKCTFIWSDSKKDKQEVAKFLDLYHIQGSVGCRYVIKVLYDNELIGCATFGKHHRNSTDWVLSRFCTKQNYTIQGGLAKISKIASKELSSDLISWAHYRLSDGNGYKKSGWIEEELLKPDYFYHKGLRVTSKQSRQKKIVETPEGMTEREHAILDGLERVWDCGKIRFRYRKKINK